MMILHSDLHVHTGFDADYTFTFSNFVSFDVGGFGGSKPPKQLKAYLYHPRDTPIGLQKGTLSGLHFSTFFEIQCFLKI